MMKFKVIIDEECDDEIIAKVKSRTSLIDEIEELILKNNISNEIPGYFGNEIIMMDINEVECFFAEEGKTYAHYSDNKTYLVKKRLYELQEIIPQHFEMISKSAIANWRKVVKLKAQFSGAVNVVFKSGYIEYISRRCFSSLKRRYGL